MAGKKRKLNNSGILSNSYIPPLSAQQIDRELQKLPADSLYSLTHLWLLLPATQPVVTKNQAGEGMTRDMLCREFSKKLEHIKQMYKSKSKMKRRLINMILVEFYPNGLNTLQLAQLDVQLLVDKPNTNSWMSSTAKIVDRVEDSEVEKSQDINKLVNFTFSLDSQQFLDNFVANLANLYLTHVYISRHPYYPLILIRIQMYDHTHMRANTVSNRLVADITNKSFFDMERSKFEQDFQQILKNNHNDISTKIGKKRNGLKRQLSMQNQPQIIPHKPFYILLPVSSPHIIHTPFNPEDISTKLIIQTLETTLSNTVSYGANKGEKHLSGIIAQQKIKVFKDQDITTPMRNLNTLFTLKGISRFASSHGAWAPYAEGIADMGIFENELKHLVVSPENVIDLTDDCINADGELDLKKGERAAVASLKFKGGVLDNNSKRLFDFGVLKNNDDDGNNYQGKTYIDLDSDHEDLSIEDDNERNRLKDPYASIIPIPRAVFDVEGDLTDFLEKKYRNESNDFKFQIELLGTDIYGGLHELSVKGPIDPYLIPSWLTGENGPLSGEIKNLDLKVQSQRH